MVGTSSSRLSIAAASTWLSTIEGDWLVHLGTGYRTDFTRDVATTAI